jgi:uncharacterized protein with PIN domain
MTITDCEVIVIDSSAVIAIFRQETDAASCAQSIASDEGPIMSTANVLETSIVLRSLKKSPWSRPNAGLMISLRPQASASNP